MHFFYFIIYHNNGHMGHTYTFQCKCNPIGYLNENITL